MKDLYVDIGSTNIKWQKNGEKICSVPFLLPIVSDKNKFEVRCEDIVNIIKSLIVGVERLFLSVQMHGYVLLKNGKPVTNYISWRDQRAIGVEPNFTITKDYGVDIKPNLPRLSLQIQTVEYDEFCTLGSYIVYRLTGINKSHVTDIAPSGFLNLKKRKYDDVSFKLPAVCYSMQSVGEYQGVKIFTPVGDQQSAILGAVGTNFNGLILNLGTAGQLCCIKDNFSTGEYESRPFFHEKTLCTVTRLIGGAIIAEYKDEDILPMLEENYGQAMGKLPKYDNLVFVGGVTKYRKILLEKLARKLEKNCSFASGDAIKGLEILAKGEIL